MQSQLDHFKQLCEISDEEEQDQVPTSVEETEEKKSASVEESKGE